MCVGVSACLGWSGIRVAGWSTTASTCNTDTNPNQPRRNSNTHRTKNNTTNVVIQQNSRKLLMMYILMPETCWAHTKWNKIASDINLVSYSSTKHRGLAFKLLPIQWTAVNQALIVVLLKVLIVSSPFEIGLYRQTVSDSRISTAGRWQCLEPVATNRFECVFSRLQRSKVAVQSFICEGISGRLLAVCGPSMGDMVCLEAVRLFRATTRTFANRLRTDTVQRYRSPFSCVWIRRNCISRAHVFFLLTRVATM